MMFRLFRILKIKRMNHERHKKTRKKELEKSIFFRLFRVFRGLKWSGLSDVIKATIGKIPMVQNTVLIDNNRNKTEFLLSLSIVSCISWLKRI